MSKSSQVQNKFITDWEYYYREYKKRIDESRDDIDAHVKANVLKRFPVLTFTFAVGDRVVPGKKREVAYRGKRIVSLSNQRSDFKFKMDRVDKNRLEELRDSRRKQDRKTSPSMQALQSDLAEYVSAYEGLMNQQMGGTEFKQRLDELRVRIDQLEARCQTYLEGHRGFRWTSEGSARRDLVKDALKILATHKSAYGNIKTAIEEREQQRAALVADAEEKELEEELGQAYRVAMQAAKATAEVEAEKKRLYDAEQKRLQEEEQKRIRDEQAKIAAENKRRELEKQQALERQEIEKKQALEREEKAREERELEQKKFNVNKTRQEKLSPMAPEFTTEFTHVFFNDLTVQEQGAVRTAQLAKLLFGEKHNPFAGYPTAIFQDANGKKNTAGDTEKLHEGAISMKSLVEKLAVNQIAGTYTSDALIEISNIHLIDQLTGEEGGREELGYLAKYRFVDQNGNPIDIDFTKYSAEDMKKYKAEHPNREIRCIVDQVYAKPIVERYKKYVLPSLKLEGMFMTEDTAAKLQNISKGLFSLAVEKDYKWDDNVKDYNFDEINRDDDVYKRIESYQSAIDDSRLDRFHVNDANALSIFSQKELKRKLAMNTFDDRNAKRSGAFVVSKLQEKHSKYFDKKFIDNLSFGIQSDVAEQKARFEKITDEKLTVMSSKDYLERLRKLAEEKKSTPIQQMNDIIRDLEAVQKLTAQSMFTNINDEKRAFRSEYDEVAIRLYKDLTQYIEAAKKDKTIPAAGLMKVIRNKAFPAGNLNLALQPGEVMDKTTDPKINDKLLFSAKLLNTDNDVEVTMQDFSDEPLFTHEPVISDIRQGNSGDCYFLAPIISMIKNRPEEIKNLMVESDDHKYVFCRFYDDDYKPFYVKVDKKLPVAKESDGSIRYANAEKTPLWLQIYEKAFALSGMYAVDKAEAQESNAYFEFEKALKKAGVPFQSAIDNKKKWTDWEEAQKSLAEIKSENERLAAAEHERDVKTLPEEEQEAARKAYADKKQAKKAEENKRKEYWKKELSAFSDKALTKEEMLDLFSNGYACISEGGDGDDVMRRISGQTVEVIDGNCLNPGELLFRLRNGHQRALFGQEMITGEDRELLNALLEAASKKLTQDKTHITELRGEKSDRYTRKFFVHDRIYMEDVLEAIQGVKTLEGYTDAQVKKMADRACELIRENKLNGTENVRIMEIREEGLYSKWSKELFEAIKSGIDQKRIIDCAFNYELGTIYEGGYKSFSLQDDVELKYRDGFVNEHMLSIINYREADGKKYIVLRNPWGKGERVKHTAKLEGEEFTYHTINPEEQADVDDGVYEVELNAFSANILCVEIESHKGFKYDRLEEVVTQTYLGILAEKYKDTYKKLMEMSSVTTDKELLEVQKSSSMVRMLITRCSLDKKVIEQFATDESISKEYIDKQIDLILEHRQEAKEQLAKEPQNKKPEVADSTAKPETSEPIAAKHM